MSFSTSHTNLEFLRLQAPDSLTQVHVRVRIPKSHHADPVISNLINHYSIKVTILGALLGINGQADGWFDLAITGKAITIHEALLDLIEMEADLWLDTETNEGF